MSAAEPPHGANCAPSGGSAAAKPQAWGTHTSAWREWAARSRWPVPHRAQEGRWGYILAWLIGVPVPILIVIYLLRGCT